MKSWIEISAGCLQANFAAVQAAAPGAEVLCVLKADAYGHGAGLCAPALVAVGARWLGVADVEEGFAVREALAGTGAEEDVHLVVMCGFEPGDARGLVEGGLTPVVWTAAHVRELGAAARALGREVAVHLEVDSGMARQGAKPGAEMLGVLDALRGCPGVRCEGVFSHLCCSEVVGSGETAGQTERFAEALEQMEAFEGLPLPEFLHLENSSAVDVGAAGGWVARWAERRAQRTRRAPRSAPEGGAMRVLVRPGLALYGYTLPRVGVEGRMSPRLQPAATWKTRISGVREVAAGETVGYGATFRATGPMRLALLPVGYADGFRREASSGVGNGWVMIGRRRAAVVGRVSMNLTVVDVTGHAPEPGVGDEVVLLGEGVTAHDHALWAGTIPYEILCGMRGHRRLVG